ncbi:uncharacterized protein LOC105178571 [Sesamum indicum]|uniref:Uncharacterized protein LOC105178571 n=1 Tax=Sesamum indicum TaxID=4182 RepID=A0A6I9UJ53_SESIN|nr:uncharacterized protein LOC105178571 [Sesamum indicum]
MEDGDGERYVFPLTSLQIGDLQSYLSHLSLFLASESGKFYILVDNRPWLEDLVLSSTHWWQLMVTKSRLSPFANTRGRKEGKMIGEFSGLQDSSSSDVRKSQNFIKWLSFTAAMMLSRNKALLPVKKLSNSLIANSKLHRTLYGFIVFEVAWNDVRGINYLNELQTDTSLAIEAKIMRRWEFDSTTQAARSISSWFPGSHNERILLKEHLDETIGEEYHDAQESFAATTLPDTTDIIPVDMSAGNGFTSFQDHITDVCPDKVGNRIDGLRKPPQPGSPFRRRKVMKSICCDAELGICNREQEFGTVEVLRQTSNSSDCEETLEATLYRDVLILFRFDDPDLPFKLRDIIMSKLRLLTLLEAGLPSWVIFLQSYPGFCRLYRPWMCPLARALYILISVVTVLIGFFDLYKNVPLLKATASHLCGPLFDWIEEWEMISRIKYLGTMLFLHNFKKAMKFSLMLSQTTYKFFSLVIKPITRPFIDLLACFLPLWSLFTRLAGIFFSVIWVLVQSSFSMVEDIIEILVLPLWYILLLARTVTTSFLYPIFWILRLIAFFCTFVYRSIGGLWLSARTIFQFSKDVESTVSTYQVSVWRSLWNDLFSQVFRALRSILNGFVVFFIACNRHRLSIYNHVKELIHRLIFVATRTWSKDKSQSGQTSEARLKRIGKSSIEYQMKRRMIVQHPYKVD